MQLSGFYKFQCNKCSERQTFLISGLTQHCREKHQTKGFVSYLDQTLWERDELLDHMLDHKDSYSGIYTLLLSCSTNSLFSVASSALRDSLALQNFLVYTIVKIIRRIKIRLVCVGQCVCLYVCGSVYM